MARPFLSVIIPSRNAARCLPLTLLTIDRHLAGQEFSYELIVVDDGSYDETGVLLEKFSGLINHLKYIREVTPQGVGKAVVAGLRAARGAWRLVLDPAETVSITEYLHLLPTLSEGARFPIIIGSRRLRGAKTVGLPIGSRCTLSLLNYAARLLFRHKVRDCFTAFHCVSEEAAVRLVDTFRAKGRAWSAELILNAAGQGFPVREFPVSARYSRYLLPRASEYLQIFWELVTLRWQNGRRTASKKTS